ncbi:RNA polymerase-binding transcription factor DksA [Burkholderiales bacterium 8X]|nr:RNA polymerase-binding transcription factor DksA [Burkholderiales bacterium 8X]
MNKAAAKTKPAAKPAVKKTASSGPSSTSAAAKAVTSTSKTAAKTAATAKSAPVKAAPTKAATAKATSPAPSPTSSTGARAESTAPRSIPMNNPADATPSNSPNSSRAAAGAPASPPPARGGRVSRLSQLTVPGMAQSVASTAPKSSFTPRKESALPSEVAVKKDPKLANNWKTKSAEELTDAEVIAMPDSEYMNDKQMAFFRLKLQELKNGILENAGETTEHLREDTVVVPDPTDRATIEEEHAIELRTRDRERKLLKKIEQSIQRIDAGDYGYCDETGEPIGIGRLLARPTATLALEAQQRRELRQKMFGD